MNTDVSGARYDAIADSYAAEFTSAADPVCTALLELAGPLAGLTVLDIACGHGRLSRELAGRGARVTGLDISARLIELAEQAEQARPLGISYLVADIARWQPAAVFDLVTCSFGLSDIDDLDGCAQAVAGALRPGGRFAVSILHPCFGGGANVSGSWPAGQSYYDERRWNADGELSTLRRQVGANHRMLSTYITTMRRHGLRLDQLTEPAPPAQWAAARSDAARQPVYLVTSFIRS
jgi:2-polyprenyl-3-methyl-5-hydroxy-6-metoxy-1,4-benzoquinol methylase